jgi:hypothetical protein
MVMTRDEHRAACIKAMAIAWLSKRGYPETDVPDWLMRQTIEEQTAALDALRSAGARVVPIEATEEMIDAAYLPESPRRGASREIWDAMSAAGDLTNPPEGK